MVVVLAMGMRNDGLDFLVEMGFWTGAVWMVFIAVSGDIMEWVGCLINLFFISRHILTLHSASAFPGL